MQVQVTSLIVIGVHAIYYRYSNLEYAQVPEKLNLAHSVCFKFPSRLSTHAMIRSYSLELLNVAGPPCINTEKLDPVDYVLQCE